MPAAKKDQPAAKANAKPKASKKADAGGVPPRGREETREALLKAASELFGGKGPDAVSVRDVASAAGVNQGLVHRHFGSKEQLIRDLLGRNAAQFREAAANTDDLPTAVTQMFGVMEENPAFIRIIAYLLLEGYDPADYMTQTGGLSRLTELAAGQNGESPPIKAAILASRIMGWLLFEPYLLYSSSYEGDPKEARSEALRAVIADIAAWDARAPTSAAPPTIAKSRGKAKNRRDE
ncbi:TetR/AcrR family transcriptional regulator [Novosphingobium kaempferiae]|uniref:TetR/AcrR family transcriptional regulator n=1 Tax=Novosphingobium kaempferiae TaxID=2896849 RepID=UPI001E530175|nr:TetR/AcrR family transcriptional regulator [Novosphingobium kaempferiae]